MTKSEFMEKINKMAHPVISEFSSDDRDLLTTCWLIEDKNDFRNKFCTPAVKLKRKEWLSGDLESFYKRESLARGKYTRWIVQEHYKQIEICK